MSAGKAPVSIFNGCPFSCDCAKWVIVSKSKVYILLTVTYLTSWNDWEAGCGCDFSDVFFKNCTKGVWTNPWQWCWILCLEDDDCPFYVFMYLFIYIAQSEICIVFPEIPECLFLFENWKFIAPFFFGARSNCHFFSWSVLIHAWKH